MVNMTSKVIGVLCAFLCFPLLLRWSLPHAAAATSASGLLFAVTVWAVATVLAGYLGYAVSLMALVANRRGKSAVALTSFRSCRDMGSWLHFEWNYVSERGGLQQGRRIAGIEIALRGRLV